MTKSEIESVLSDVPEKLFGVSPSELNKHFESIEGISQNEVDTLTAFVIIRNLHGIEIHGHNHSPWQTIKNNLRNKYSELGGSPDHPLWPVLEIVAAAEIRNKIVLVF